jgi:hypothetical protein
MLVPRLFDIAAFDATTATNVQFAWTGDQSFGSILTIRDNETNAVVYTASNESMGRTHPIPAGTLSNGTCYNAFLEILNADEEVISEKSNTVIFYCYSTPLILFDGITSDSIIPNSTYTIMASYAQEEHDVLSQYQIVLYDVNQAVVQNPGIKYQTEYTTSFNQTFTGLENNTSYYVRATGKTAHDMFVDSGFLRIFVRYENPEVFSRLDLVNDSRNGNISITSNLISIIGKTEDGEEPPYINGEMVDLRDGKVTFSDGFQFPENWTMGATVCAITKNVPMITWWDDDLKAEIIYREDKFELYGDVLKGYFELIIDGPKDENGNVIWHTIHNSNYFDPVASPETKYTLWIQKKDGYYAVNAVKAADATL